MEGEAGCVHAAGQCDDVIVIFVVCMSGDNLLSSLWMASGSPRYGCRLPFKIGGSMLSIVVVMWRGDDHQWHLGGRRFF